MQVEKKPINLEDARGAIRDILISVDIDAVTIITCAKDSVRGNHFHKQSDQYSYIVKGKFLCAIQVGDGPIETKEIEEGDLVVNPAGEKHAFKALEDSIFLSLTKGPRKGKDYEKDIFRLEKPILS